MLSDSNFNISPLAWKAAKKQAKVILKDRAAMRGMISYSDLARQITAFSFAPHDPRFFHFLGEVSSDEDDKGRGLLTVIVVHKDGDMQPGPGFFDLAESRGRDVSDILKCWVEELHAVHAVWS